MTPYLVIDDLRRSYGKRVALNGLSLTIPKNSVTAFVGSNGAGKTTTFSIVGQFIKPHGGYITVDGLPINQFRRGGGVIGLLPQDVQFFENRTLGRQLYMFARLAGLSRGEGWAEVERVLTLVNLRERIDDNPADLSRGMKVRLGVAQALVGSPPLILLDEPTAGLDPKMQLAFRENIEHIRGKTTLVISSHDLRELQALCDYVCIVDQGKLVKQGLMTDILGNSSQITFKLDNFSQHLGELMKAFESFAFKKQDEATLVVCFDPNKYRATEVNRDVLRWLLSKEIGVVGVEAQKSLEKAYLEETGK